MDNNQKENKELIENLVKQIGEPSEKNLKEVGSSSNDETNDVESSDKSKNFKFYLEFCKLYEANNTLNAHLTSLLKEKNSLKNEIQKHENKAKNIIIDDIYTNRKRHRRTKNEICRIFKCKVDGCNKNYGRFPESTPEIKAWAYRTGQIIKII